MKCLDTSAEGQIIPAHLCDVHVSSRKIYGRRWIAVDITYIEVHRAAYSWQMAREIYRLLPKSVRRSENYQDYVLLKRHVFFS